MSRLIVICVLVAMLFVAVVSNVLAGPPNPNAPQSEPLGIWPNRQAPAQWLDRAKVVVWGASGVPNRNSPAIVRAERGVTNASRNGFSLPSGQAPWLEQAANSLTRGAQNMWNNTHK